MADSYPTLLDIAALDAGIGYPVVNERVAHFPEITRFPASTMDGTTLELSVSDELPTTGFRNANEGVEYKKVAFKTKMFSSAIIEHQIAVDPKVLSSSKDRGRALEQQSAPHMDSVLRHIAKQIWYGKVGNDTKGFIGMQQQYDSSFDVDATGTTAKSSAWLLHLAPEMVELMFGNGETVTQRDWREETITLGTNSHMDGLTSSISGRVGLRVSNRFAAVRIKNLGTDTGKGLTDSLLYQAIEKFETNLQLWPNVIFINPRSAFQLRTSRQAVRDATAGNGSVEPLPQDWEGIPMVRTINLLTTE